MYHDDEPKLSYKEAKPLITSIITALNNAMAYGNKKSLSVLSLKKSHGK